MKMVKIEIESETQSVREAKEKEHKDRWGLKRQSMKRLSLKGVRD